MIMIFRLFVLAACIGLSLTRAEAQELRVRAARGFEVPVPPGWQWSALRPAEVTFQHAGEAHNKFSLALCRCDPLKASDWDSIVLQNSIDLGGGRNAQFVIGPRWGGIHTVFEGRINLGDRIVRALHLDGRTMTMDPQKVAAAFLAVARGARSTPEGNRAFHPANRFSVDLLDSKRWMMFSSGNLLGVASCSDGRCGGSGAMLLYAYASTAEFADSRAALGDITGYFEKQNSLKIGPARWETVTDGEAGWTEQPGSLDPFLGALKLGNRYVFARGRYGDNTMGTLTIEQARAD